MPEEKSWKISVWRKIWKKRKKFMRTYKGYIKRTILVIQKFIPFSWAKFIQKKNNLQTTDKKTGNRQRI